MKRTPPMSGVRPSEPMDWERPSERFLAYLDRLSEACIAHDREQLDKLLRMRLSSHLPRGILDEMEFFRRARGGGGEGGAGAGGGSANLRAPLRLMRYVHKMKQLAAAAPSAEKTQLPLELRERDVAAPPAVAPTRRRPTPRRSQAQEPE